MSKRNLGGVFSRGRMIVDGQLPKWMPLSELVSVSEGLCRVAYGHNAMVVVTTHFDSVTISVRDKHDADLCFECGTELDDRVSRVSRVPSANQQSGATPGRAIMLQFCEAHPS